MIYFIGDNVNFDGIENSSINYMLDYFQNHPDIGYDCETEGFNVFTDKLLSYQLGDNINQFVIDAKQYPIELVKDLLLSKTLIIHNAKFDLKWLYQKNIYPQHIWDSYLAECVLYKGDKTVRKSLETAVHRYFNYRLTKASRGLIFREKFTKRVIEYCSEDVKFLLALKEVQHKRLDRLDLLNSMSLENEFVKVLTYIEYSGIYLDADLWKKKIAQDVVLRDNSIKDLNNWIINNNITEFIDTQLNLFNTDTITTINWDSPKQVTVLFKKLGINTEVPDEKGGIKDSVEAGVLEKQIHKSTLVPVYLQYKKYEKILSTYGESVLDKINPVTNRIHTQFTQIMDTGRLSSGGKMGDKETINLQNIPALPDKNEEGKIYERECFVASEGCTLINADYSGQEQVVFANWTLDEDLLEFYKKDLGDMHAFIASKIFPYLKDIPLKQIKTKYKAERQKAKYASFALNYGGNGLTIAENLNISTEEGDAIYKAYFTAFPGISNYFKRVTAQSLSTGYILFNTISKSKCFIGFWDTYKNLDAKVNHPGFWDRYREEKLADSLLFRNDLKPLVSKYFRLRGNISRMAINYPIQGSSSEITKLAAIYIFNYILENHLQGIVKFSNIIHDEVLLEVPVDISSILRGIVEDCMIRAGKVYCKTVPLKAEVVITNIWKH